MISDKRKSAKLNTEFKNFFDTKFQNDFPELERQRKKYLLYFWILCFVSIIVIGVIHTSVVVVGDQDLAMNDNYVTVMFFLIAIAIYIIHSPINRFKEHVKNQVMGRLLSYFGNFSYFYQRGINSALIEKTCLFGHYDDKEDDDFFIGYYKDVEIMVAEEEITKVVRTRKGSRRVTVFDGIIIELDMNKPFNGQTIVKTDHGIFNRFYCVSNMENVKLEDVVFEKHFEVYSTDQIEARYVLTTAFMERMLKLKEVFKGKQIQFSFFDNKVIIAIDTSKDMFEVSSLFHKIPDYKRACETFNQITAVFSIIDILLSVK